jgi:hypothetical protein
MRDYTPTPDHQHVLAGPRPVFGLVVGLCGLGADPIIHAEAPAALERANVIACKSVRLWVVVNGWSPVPHKWGGYFSGSDMRGGLISYAQRKILVSVQFQAQTLEARFSSNECFVFKWINLIRHFIN